ncbi:TraR/DksA family transcriptional regulator [Noviherbaspirillum saxi]|uniref:TraR/DksA family transcriptional regulator n=1 Tax=Noviherbaspirillum saxi TaxID=2320863 RepID=A0A3A3FW30_9BURK|nr:TraR/DksA family transcriptional regulator [Noviherbaspirillum saxi]RJF98351.1 TraR/DksA family transcriptional regulator [Noviherbaspirillum saxi]
MAHLNEQQIGQLRQMLDKRYDELREELHQEVNDRDGYLDVATEAPDPGDASFANLTLDLDNAATTRDVTELHAIEATRVRIEDKTYGTCVDCETAIPFERLKAQLTAERCTPCQEAYEKKHLDAGRGATI